MTLAKVLIGLLFAVLAAAAFVVLLTFAAIWQLGRCWKADAVGHEWR